MELTVECQKRESGSKPNALRREGLIPAVLYGHKGTESVSLTLSEKTAKTLVKDAVINNTLIRVKIPGWSGKALLRDVQSHPWKGLLYHLSFFSVAAQDSLEVTVPMHFVGEAVGVKDEGGSIDTSLTELQVECAPDQIPEAIAVDVSQLHMGDTVYVHQLVLPEGVTVLGEPDRVAVSILPPQLIVEPEEEATETEATEEGTKATAEAES
ncbi:LSU ribosomal protein L25p [uncultured Synechococcales cyanobacterium]|uniref:Large ribosomal subunit protein bL25 n=1 Tax=uncultured Synechococcales cyanobacterium TaxID=1936017 RepID=A0A6J4UW00_9CYAN|nr:LSU ribosomal protein L25p [uncultured Synechococcales cyanobacterium]